MTKSGRYVVLPYMANAPDRELKKGNAELLILALLEDKARHGYEIGKLIAERSEGVLRFHVASLYPLLYRLERRGWVKGEWEPAGGRRRRYYRLTPTGRKILAEQRSRWRAFSGAVNRIVEAGAAHRTAENYSMEAQHA
ncbi:MAG TPA: PadR family transcriptional regulator [Candidatus Acidoferrum sp.]|nr:PadR family transcriptional regulator [Candidatus Acidoferrum sp.]